MTDHDFEQQVRADLREALDRELGPDPTWAESPAARARGRGGGSAPPALAAARAGRCRADRSDGGAAALLGGGPSEVPPPEALASRIARPMAGLRSPLQEAPAGDDTDPDIWFVAPTWSRASRRHGLGRRRSAVPCVPPDGRTLAYGAWRALAITLATRPGGQVIETLLSSSLMWPTTERSR